MEIYFAPLEGITGYVFRNAHNQIYQGINKYYTPFITPKQKTTFNSRGLTDIIPENNKGINVIPQVLTNSHEDFLFTIKQMEFLGYNEINLNLGCPSNTVVKKNKGSGFLGDINLLDEFLYNIFNNETKISISIKTRTGISNIEEFYKLLEIYNKYPLKELIIHPRLQKDYYGNKPNLDIFSYAEKNSKNPICYNGDIFTLEDFINFKKLFPNVSRIMLGRGIISNPSLAENILGFNTSKEKFIDFLNLLSNNYKDFLSGEKNILFKKKELWSYFIFMFDNNEKYKKKIHKAQSLKSLCEIEKEILENLNFRESTLFKGNR